MKNIFEKLEELRQKPEHVRMRYVWLLVTVSMILVIAVWALSLVAGNSNLDSQSKSAANTAGSIEGLDDAKNQFQNVTNGISNTAGMLNDQIMNQVQGQEQQGQ